jgi:uncharacterized protein (TIGR04255 family)
MRKDCEIAYLLMFYDYGDIIKMRCLNFLDTLTIIMFNKLIFSRQISNIFVYICCITTKFSSVQYSNKHLTEVNCGFQFPEESVAWDSTFFGQFYEKIKELGFTDREERKGVQIRFNGNVADSKLPITTSHVEDQVVFRDKTKGLAILLGKGKISFHCVNDYKNWEVFLKTFIIPFSELYKSLGLGNGKRQCSVVYLNRFTKKAEDKLSDYFTIVNSLEQKFGQEVATSIQRIVTNPKNQLVTKLNSQQIGGIQNINLECGAVCINEECMKSDDWSYQANQTHEPIFEFFEAIISEKLRGEL